MLSGWKTYLAVAVALATVVLGYVNGEFSNFEAALYAAISAAIGALRRGVHTETTPGA